MSPRLRALQARPPFAATTSNAIRPAGGCAPSPSHVSSTCWPAVRVVAAPFVSRQPLGSAVWPLAAVARVLLGCSCLEAARVPAVFSGEGRAVARLWCGLDVMTLSVSLELADGDVCMGHAVHMSIDDAAYRVVHEYGAPALAARLGMSVQVLRNKANPQLTTHVFRPQELEDIQLLSGKPYVLHSMAHALGYVCQRAMPGQAQGDVMLAQTRAVDALAELLRAYGDGVRMGDGAATLNAVRRVEHCAQLAMEAINDLTATLRGRMRPVPGGQG